MADAKKMLPDDTVKELQKTTAFDDAVKTQTVQGYTNYLKAMGKID